MSQVKNPWDERYQMEGFFYGTEPNDFLSAEVSRFKPGGRILCLAEGEGRNAVFLAKQGFQVLGVDGSEVGLSKARTLASQNQVSLETRVADLAEYGIEPASWDGIVSIWCHLPSALRAEVHRKCIEGLSAGGIFVLEAYRPKQLEYGTGGPKVVDLLPTLEQLMIELRGLEMLHAKELDRDIREGQGHQGMSAVVQVVARKAWPGA